MAIRSLCADETGTWYGWSVTLYADLMTMRIAIEALAEARSALESFGRSRVLSRSGALGPRRSHPRAAQSSPSVDIHIVPPINQLFKMCRADRLCDLRARKNGQTDLTAPRTARHTAARRAKIRYSSQLL